MLSPARYTRLGFEPLLGARTDAHSAQGCSGKGTPVYLPFRPPPPNPSRIRGSGVDWLEPSLIFGLILSTFSPALQFLPYPILMKCPLIFATIVPYSRIFLGVSSWQPIYWQTSTTSSAKRS